MLEVRVSSVLVMLTSNNRHDRVLLIHTVSIRLDPSCLIVAMAAYRADVM